MAKSVSAGRFMQRTRLSFDKANFARLILDRSRLAFDRSCWGWARNRRKMTWKGRAWAGNRHSDKEKFYSDLNGPKTPKMSEQPLKTLRKSGDF